MNNKLTYFIDLDGTLFDKNGIRRISHKNLQAILMLRNFANVVLSTGRYYNDLRVQQALMSLGISDIICNSGAEVYIDNKQVFSIPIEQNTFRKIIEFATKQKIIFVLFDQKGEHIYHHSKFWYVLTKMFLAKKLKSFNYAKNINFEKDFINRTITKVAFIFDSPKKNIKALEGLKRELDNKIQATSASNNYVIEITDQSVNKAISTINYCEQKNIDLKNTIHIGDSMSDSILKGVVGKLVAMGNAKNDFKEIADEIAPNYKNGGLYKYFINKSKLKKVGEND